MYLCKSTDTPYLHSVHCLCEAKMLLAILHLNFILLSLTDAEPADVKSSSNLGLEDGLGNLVEKLESRLRDLETKMQNDKEKEAKEKKELESRLEAKDKEMERRLQEFEERMKEEKHELQKRDMIFKASTSKLRMEVEEEIASNISNNNALTNPSLRDLPIVFISAWQGSEIRSPQTVTFESFLANFNNNDRPGGGDGVLDLDSGVFTCFTPGYYQVSFSALGHGGPDYTGRQTLYLYKNGAQLPESNWYCGGGSSFDDNFAVTGSRILVSCLFAWKL